MERIDYMSVAEKLMDQIKKGAFLTVRAGEQTNTMTIGWGLIGFVWRKPIFMIAVRNSRHTFPIIEKAADFTLTFPTKDMHEALMFCGSKSGRDVDKYKACNLKLEKAQQTISPIIATPATHLECKIRFKAPMDPEYLDKGYQELYPAKDYHTLYFGEIVDCYSNG
jgi:flavin reductase (DIM6/NTAB) family NADH-FMN oxidoreductase RutF